MNTENGLPLPVYVPQGNETLALLEQIAASLDRTGASAQSAGQRAESGASGWDRSIAAARTAADTYNEVTGALTSIIGTINSAVERVTSLASEQERLTRQAARLGLDFDAAADAAGKFTDETEAMAAATEIAETGVALTQQQLEALTRTAASYAQNTGSSMRESIDRLTQGLISGSERGLRPFGADLQAVSGDAHTMADRLAALVEHAANVPQATDSAADSVARFKDRLEDASRTIASSFLEELSRLEEASRTNVGGAAEQFDTLSTRIDAVGRVAARVFHGIYTGANLVVEALATSIYTVGELTAALARMNEHPTQSADIARETMGNLRASFDQLRAAAHAFTSSFGDGGANDNAAPGAASEGLGRAFSRGASGEELAYVSGHDDPSAGGRRAAGGGARRERGADMTFTMEDAYDSTGSAGAQSREATARFREGLRRTTEGRASEERGVDALLSTERSRDEAAGVKSRTAATREETAMLDRAAARERQRFEERIDAQKSFTERWEEMHHHQFNASQELAEGLDKAFKSVGDALARHIEAVISGQETVGEALQNILADVLDSFSKEALMKGAFYTAEALAAIVRYDFPGAATAGAAAAAYFAVGAAAGLGAQAIHTQPAASGGHASGGGGSSGGSDKVLSGRSASNDTAPPQVVNHYYAPVIGGRDATAAEVGARMNRFTDATGQRQTRERAA